MSFLNFLSEEITVKLMEPKSGLSAAEVISIVLGGLGFIGAIINFIFMQKHYKVTRSAEIITANRVDWMQKLREEVSLYITNLYSYISIDDADKNKYWDKVDECTYNIRLNQTRINLMLNFNDKYDNLIRKTMERLYVFLKYVKRYDEGRNYLIPSLKDGIEYLQIITTIYLKCEWERTKEYAKNGEIIREKKTRNNSKHNDEKDEEKESFFNKRFNDYYNEVFEKCEKLKMFFHAVTFPKELGKDEE